LDAARDAAAIEFGQSARGHQRVQWIAEGEYLVRCVKAAALEIEQLAAFRCRVMRVDDDLRANVAIVPGQFFEVVVPTGIMFEQARAVAALGLLVAPCTVHAVVARGKVGGSRVAMKSGFTEQENLTGIVQCTLQD
ncbi:hypothetical protein BUY31_12900, partial [Staphylococcus cohnii]